MSVTTTGKKTDRGRCGWKDCPECELRSHHIQTKVDVERKKTNIDCVRASCTDCDYVSPWVTTWEAGDGFAQSHRNATRGSSLS